MESKMIARGVYNIECFDPTGKLKWRKTIKNLITNQGLQHILDVVFNGDESANPNAAPWYLGLADGTPTPAAADTLASHGGWTEVTAYTGDRKEFVGVRANQQMTNAASKASFAINSDSTTIGGAFLGSVATGTSGVLMSIGAFSGGDESADDGDTVNVTFTISFADDGA